MKNLKVLTLILFVVTLTGCGTVLKGPKMSEVYKTLPRVQQGQARAHFIRPGEKSFGLNTRVHLDGDLIVDLPLSGCHFEEISAKKHKLMLDVAGDFGSHEMVVDFKPHSDRYFKIWPRSGRKWATVGFGVLGAAANALISDSENDGSMEFVELSQQEAVPLLEQCVHYKEEDQE